MLHAAQITHETDKIICLKGIKKAFKHAEQLFRPIMAIYQNKSWCKFTTLQQLVILEQF